MGGTNGTCGNVELNLSAILEKCASKCCAISSLSSITASLTLILLIWRQFFPESVSVLIVFHIPLELPLFSSKALQKNFLFALLIIATALFLSYQSSALLERLAVIRQLSLRCSCFKTELVIQGAWTARFKRFSRQGQFSSSTLLKKVTPAYHQPHQIRVLYPKGPDSVLLCIVLVTTYVLHLLAIVKKQIHINSTNYRLSITIKRL